MNIGFGITGSFCTHKKILEELEELVKKGYNIVPIVTTEVYKTTTRFGSASNFIKNIEKITNNKVINNIVAAEPLGPKKLIDVLVIAPCTGNTLSKLANAQTDNAVTMTAKSLMRNNKPVIIGISTNDALGLNMYNIAKLINTKGIFFIPMHQDDPINKPKSLIANWEKLEETLLNALKNTQIQPLLYWSLENIKLTSPPTHKKKEVEMFFC